MFDIFIKKKKIIVDCFTDNLNSYDLFPIQESSNFFPKWWKDLPKTDIAENRNGMTIERSSMKRCEGFINLYQNGFIIPLWSDVIIQTLGLNYTFEFADAVSSLSYHDSEQMGGEFYNFTHVKFDSPWRVKEKTGVHFVFLQPSWNNPVDLLTCHTPPGVIDFEYQHTTSINLLLMKTKRYEWAAGRPMAQLIPISDHNVEIKTHLVSSVDIETMRVMNRSQPFFQSSYRKVKNIKNLNCPFKGK